MGQVQEPRKIELTFWFSKVFDNLLGHKVRFQNVVIHSFDIASVWVCLVKESGPNGAWIDRRHMDTKGHQFQTQGIGEANGRKLGRRIKAGFGSCDETRHADDVNNVPLACCLHAGTNQTLKLHEGKGIDLKHGMNLLIGNLVKLFKNPIACVVDQDIDLPIALIELFYQILDG